MMVRLALKMTMSMMMTHDDEDDEAVDGLDDDYIGGSDDAIIC